MKKLLICALILAMLAVPALADEDDNFVLKLRANPTTGYTWQYVIEDAALLEVTDAGYVVDNPELIGSGGTYQFILKGLRDGKTTVTFTYSRAWEAEVSALCVIKFVVETDSDGDAKAYICEVSPGTI